MQKLLSLQRGAILARWFAVLTVFVLAAAAFTSPVAAAQPITWDQTDSGGYVDDALCPFPVMIDYTVAAKGTLYINNSGEWEMMHFLVVEQDTLSANGKTLVGKPYTFTEHHYFAPSPGEPDQLHASIQGVYLKYHLPSGTLVLNAGRLYFTHEGTTYTGNFDITALCDALAPE